MATKSCGYPRRTMADLIEVPSGLEGVIAFDTSIAEPDKEGGALRYRGVDIEELVGHVPFERVWGLLVDGSYEPGMPPAEPHPLSVRTGDPRADLQAALAMLAPEWGLQALIDITRRAGPRRPGARLGHGAVVRGPVGARRRPPAGPPARGRQGVLDPRALPDPLARRGRPQARQGDRRLLDLGRRARHERLHLHRARGRLDRRRRRRRAVRRGGRAVGAAARRRSLARADDARRGRGRGRRRALGQARARLAASG